MDIFEISEKEKEAQKNAMLLGDEDSDHENFVQEHTKKCKYDWHKGGGDCSDEDHHEF